MIFLFIVVSLTGFVLESSLLSFPITFLFGALVLAYLKKVYLYILVFLNGFIIDSLRIENFLYTPFFLLATIGAIYLYERVSGSRDILVSTVIIFTAMLLYANVMYYSIPLLIGFYFIAILGFIIFNMLKKNKYSI